jgi:predicted ATP-grasp superfamily ATP-dependent carboligase
MARPAVVMNMFYTGLGIARSLGEHGIPVIGLTAQPGVYGNYTRYAKTRLCPDSRTRPEELLDYLLRMGRELAQPAVIFPTRDDDVAFLDRYRVELSPYFLPVIPDRAPLRACLNKWETYQWACKTGVTAPKSWLVESEDELARQLPEIRYPCVLKPLSSHHWRRPGKWDMVGNRKAVAIQSSQQLLAEYATISQAEPRAIVQELVPGKDDCLVIVACYFDQHGRWVAGFNTKKVVQVPEGFGTGCIVQASSQPELLPPTRRLLEAMKFSGIAEVEYKWDAAKQTYQLIEINPRPWDQHRLGKCCGTDLSYLAYCDRAGLPVSETVAAPAEIKWIAEDALLLELFSLIWKRDRRALSLLKKASGKRIYAISSWSDPLPVLMYLKNHLVPLLARQFLGRIKGMIRARHMDTKTGACV